MCIYVCIYVCIYIYIYIYIYAHTDVQRRDRIATLGPAHEADCEPCLANPFVFDRPRRLAAVCRLSTRGPPLEIEN